MKYINKYLYIISSNYKYVQYLYDGNINIIIHQDVNNYLDDIILKHT